MKFNIDSNSTPLDSEMIKARMLTHNFANTFFHELVLASDSIITSEPEKQIQLNALVWKINASSEAKNKIFQNNPEIALLDTWILSATISDFLKDSSGNKLFGNSQEIAVNTSDMLLAKIDTIAYSFFKNNYKEAKCFVDSIRKNEPYQSLSFYKESVYHDWYRYQNIPDSLIDVNNGTLAQVLSDFSTRMGVGSEQIFRQAKWNGELMYKQSDLDSLNIQEMSNNFDNRFDELIIVLKNSGRTMQEDTKIFRKDMVFLRRNFDAKFDSIFSISRSELAILRDSLRSERKAIMSDIDQTSNKLVKTALSELRIIINDILFYVLLILIVILFIPFALGFITGKNIERKKKK